MRILRLVDLMRLVATDVEPHKVLEKAYDWEHARWLEIGKWFLATGAGTLVGLVTIVAKNDAGISLTVVILSSISGASIIIGLGAFWRVRYIAARYARARAIAGELVEMKSFLALLRKRGML